MVTFFYSPFSPNTMGEKNHPSLLLQFILKELLKAIDKVPEHPSSEGPFQWTAKRTSSEKLTEFFTLLPYAFPHLKADIPSLQSPPEELIILLEPFIMACKDNENFLLFLIRHEKECSIKTILDKIAPEGREALKRKIAEWYQKRSYRLIPRLF